MLCCLCDPVFSRFSRTPTYDRHRQTDTDRHRHSIRTSYLSLGLIPSSLMQFFVLFWLARHFITKIPSSVQVISISFARFDRTNYAKSDLASTKTVDSPYSFFDPPRVFWRLRDCGIGLMQSRARLAKSHVGVSDSMSRCRKIEKRHTLASESSKTETVELGYLVITLSRHDHESWRLSARPDSTRFWSRNQAYRRHAVWVNKIT